MTIQVSPPCEAGRISTNWYDISHKGADSYVDWFNFETQYLDWLQLGVQQIIDPLKKQKKAVDISCHM